MVWTAAELKMNAVHVDIQER